MPLGDVMSYERGAPTARCRSGGEVCSGWVRYSGGVRLPKYKPSLGCDFGPFWTMGSVILASSGRLRRRRRAIDGAVLYRCPVGTTKK